MLPFLELKTDGLSLQDVSVKYKATKKPRSKWLKNYLKQKEEEEQLNRERKRNLVAAQAEEAPPQGGRGRLEAFFSQYLEPIYSTVDGTWKKVMTAFDPNQSYMMTLTYLQNTFKYPANYKDQMKRLDKFQFWDATSAIPVDVMCQLMDQAKQVAMTNMGLDGEDVDVEDFKTELINTGYYLRRDLSNKRIAVIGDTHGSLHSLCNVMRTLRTMHDLFDQERRYLAEDVYVICLGDMLDRSPYTMEVLYLMLRLYVENPTQVTITLGNHETDTGLWYNPDGSSYEMLGEYPQNCKPGDFMGQTIYETLQCFPRSLIAITSLGKVQFNHGSFENIVEQSEINEFKSFVDFSDTTYDVMQILHLEEKRLTWGDVATSPTGVEIVQASTMGRPLASAYHLGEYLKTFGLRLLIRGHSDLANLSIMYANVSSGPSYRLQAENAEANPPPQPIVWNVAGRKIADQRSNLQDIPRGGTFVRNAKTALENEPLYDMYTLVMSPNQRNFSKTLIHPKLPSESRNLVAVTTSTANFSKINPPMMTMTSYLWITTDDEPNSTDQVA
jgi:hypothetical protein